MALTNTQVKNAKPKDKQYRLSDQGGLSLIVRPTGSKAWKYDYRMGGKRLTHTIGTYPETSLAEARDAHTAARRLVKTGANPTTIKNQGPAASKPISRSVVFKVCVTSMLANHL